MIKARCWPQDWVGTLLPQGIERASRLLIIFTIQVIRLVRWSLSIHTNIRILLEHASLLSSAQLRQTLSLLRLCQSALSGRQRVAYSVIEVVVLRIF